MTSYLYFLVPLDSPETFFERLKAVLRGCRQDNIVLEETPAQMRFVSPAQTCLLTFKLQNADWVKFESQGIAKHGKGKQTRAILEQSLLRVEMWGLMEALPILEAIQATEQVFIFDCGKRSAFMP